jgi:hypothetical protein
MTVVAKSPRRVRPKAHETRVLLRRLVDNCRHPAQLIELYYWSVETDLVRVMQEYIALPDGPKSALRAFLSMTRHCPETVQATVTDDGQITLSSSHISEKMSEMTST